MIKTYYAYAIRAEDGTYSPIHTRGTSTNDSKIPVVEDASTARERIKGHVLPGNGINLEGVVINITSLVVSGILEKGRLDVLN